MNRSREMSSEFFDSLCIFLGRLAFCIAGAAIVALVYQYGAPSAEFRAISSRFGREPWAKKLLRLGKFLADRTRWTLAAAFSEAIQRDVLSPEEFNSSVRELAGLPDGAVLSAEPGDSFDPKRMEADSEEYPWVLSTTQPGLIWRGKTLVKARVRTTSADSVMLSLTAEHPLTKHLLSILGEPVGAQTQITRGALNGTLDSVPRSEDRDAWLRQLHTKAPGESFKLIEPVAGVAFQGETMESTELLSAPQHAVVSVCQCVGLRRAGAKGEVLAPALVVAHVRPREGRI